MPLLGDLAAFLALATVAGIAGLAFGILILAPRLSRLADRSDEEPGARDD